MNADDRELEQELANGRRLAGSLVEHVQWMGAAKASIPVWVDGELWDVVATKSAINDLTVK